MTAARLQLAPSILTADFARIGDEVAAVAPYVDWFHLDVMDGHYVDNLTFGPSTVEAIDRVVDNPLHVHLMIDNPAKFAPAFARVGADRISFHPEVVSDIQEVVDVITAEGARPGFAVHPDVALEAVERHLDQLDVILMMTVRPGFGGQSFLSEVLPKIEQARELVARRKLSADIEVDGGVNLSTVEDAVAAGGRILVAGSAIFDGVDCVAAAQSMRRKLDELALAHSS